MITDDKRGCWQVWVDTGGTFTDCVALDPRGDLHRVKVLSSGSLRVTGRPGGSTDEILVEPTEELPRGFLVGCRLARLGSRSVAADKAPHTPEAASAERHRKASALAIRTHEPSEGRIVLERPLEPPLRGPQPLEAHFGEPAPIVAARLVTRTPREGSLPPLSMRLATTLGTNALLERRGGAIALFVTRGFADLLRIGTQQRDELFTLRPGRPEPLYAAVVEVQGRLDAEGNEVEPLDLDALRPAIEATLERGVRGAAVALLHSFRNPDHEERLSDCLRKAGFEHVSRSSRLAPRIQILPRAETAVVDAYLAGTVRSYLNEVEAAIPDGDLLVMTSAGGLVEAKAYAAKDSLLSGPAGGAVGAAVAGRRAGIATLLAFDMGGTSTDVYRFAGEPEYRFETRIAGVRLLAPALAIETVAAGGGSICAFDGSQLKVGPESAGATPGPACYGAGGPCTLTDVNLLLGRLAPDRLPIPVSEEAARSTAEALLDEIDTARGERPELLPTIAGLLQIANERMAEAVRRLSIRRGYAPAEHALLAFGGAGPQHACALADILGVEKVLVPPDAGLLSALGLGAAAIERFAERQVLEPLERVRGRLATWLDELARKASARLAAAPRADADGGHCRAFVQLRLAGQESALVVEVEPGNDPSELAPRFRRLYRQQYGYEPGDQPIEVESLRVAVSARAARQELPDDPATSRAAAPAGRTRAYLAGGWREIALHERADLEPGHRLEGPALVLEDHSTTVVEPDWRLRVDGVGSLVIER